MVVFLWWCLWWRFCGDRWCGGVFVLVWWCSCGGVCVVVFLFWCGGVFVVVFVCLCFCGGGGGVFVVVYLCFCGGVFVCFFCQGSTFVALPRSYAKSVDNTGVKRCLV